MVANKVYVIGVGMSKFIKPRGEVDYPGTEQRNKNCFKVQIVKIVFMY